MASNPSKQQMVELHQFEQVMESDERSGDGMLTTLACFLLTLLLTDALLILNSASPLTGPLARWFARHHIEYLIPPSVLLLQAAVYYIGLQCLRASTLSTTLESRPKSLLTFGLGSWSGVQTRAFAQRVAVFSVVFAGLGYFFFLVPDLPLGTAKAGIYAFALLRFLTPPAVAWLSTTLIFRSRIDRSVAIGLAGAAAILILASVAGGGGSSDADAQAGTSIGAVESAWFSLVELFMIWTVLVSFWMVMVSNHFHRHVYKLVGTGVEKAPLVLQSSPFGRIDRTPRFLLFQLGEAKVIALTRLHDAEAYEVVNTMDEHLILPIHDRSIKLWNINALEARIPRRIQCLDPHGYFQLNVTLGTLTAASLSNARRAVIGKHAVDFATENVFTNKDLSGILTLAAGNAFAAYTQNQVEELEDISRVLDGAPARATVPFTDNHLQSEDQLNSAVARIAALQSAISSYMSRLDQARSRFVATRNRLTNWHNPVNTAAQDLNPGVPNIALEDIWYQQILRQFQRNSQAVSEFAGAHGETWHRETQNVFAVLGLRFNEVSVQLGDRALKIDEKIKQTRSSMDELLRHYEAQYDEAISRRTLWKQGLVEKMVGVPGTITPRIARDVLIGIISGPGTTSTPFGASSANSQQLLAEAARTGRGADPQQINSAGKSQNGQSSSAEVAVEKSRTDDADLV